MICSVCSEPEFIGGTQFCKPHYYDYLNLHELHMHEMAFLVWQCYLDRDNALQVAKSLQEPLYHIKLKEGK